MNTPSIDRSIKIVGLTVYALLCGLAVWFYLERTCFIDISFHLFYIIKDSDFAIQNHRFVAFFTQLFPLLGSKLGLELNQLMVLYSASFVVLNILVFSFLASILKQWKYALTLIFVNTLLVSHTFYWVQSELQQGLSFMLLYFGLLQWRIDKNNNNQWIELGLIILAFTVAFAHPLLLFPVTFMSIYLGLIHRDKWKNYWYYWIMYMVFYIIKNVLIKTPYDSNAMSASKNVIKYFPDYISIPSNKAFVQEVMHNYYLLIIGFLILLAYFIKERAWLKGGLVGTFFIGYLMLVNISYGDGAEKFYLENMYLPLSVMVGLPIAYELIQKMKSWLIAPLLLLIFVSRIGHMYATHTPYSDRLAYLDKTIKDSKNSTLSKQVIAATPPINQKLIMNWASPYEIWLLSTTKYKSTASIMIADDPSGVIWALPNTSKFITPWGVFDYTELPSKYFKFEDTSTPYHYIKAEKNK